MPDLTPKALLQEDFRGLAFVNLVETDMTYGHRRDVDGYAGAVSAFDRWLGEFLPLMGKEDVLMITADHGCDPGFRGTDHTREYVPFLACGQALRQNVNLKTRASFADIAKTILDIWEIEAPEIPGESFKKDILL